MAIIGLTLFSTSDLLNWTIASPLYRDYPQKMVETFIIFFNPPAHHGLMHEMLQVMSAPTAEVQTLVPGKAQHSSLNVWPLEE